MSEFFIPKVSIQSKIAAVRLAIAAHKDPPAERNRLRNLSWSQHKLEEEHLNAVLDGLLRQEVEERNRPKDSPPRAE